MAFLRTPDEKGKEGGKDIGMKNSEAGGDIVHASGHQIASQATSNCTTSEELPHCEV
ncbi:hypothetical protein AC579_9678 [Pseudocercospora musae]|uniref:Uncharacterized protein n=1 Tax=Pseudocercospora musae TaxID=113226 RepID=A0A139I5P9_9PEZI|nr:hypothetical protein AC579_9678 [Pseudocercospora musae]